jgi:ferredoxin
MTDQPVANGSPAVLTQQGLAALIDGLVARRYRVIGPTVRDDAIVYDDIAGIQDLPAGWRDRQEAGRYGIERRDDQTLFGFAVGPNSWKRFLHPPEERLFTVHKASDGLTITTPEEPTLQKFAFIGVRACELHAIGIQDRVFLEGPYVDRGFAVRRRDAFIVAVNCAQAGGTCFCVSMQTGPKADSGFDLALTELPASAANTDNASNVEEAGNADEPNDGRSCFVVEAGSAAGAELLAQIPHRAATEADLAAAAAVVAHTASQMGRSMQTEGIKSLLQDNLRHARWSEVGERCLSCGNCTMVCPTCFCTTVEDHTDLAGTTAERVRKWDSCFTLDFSWIHGGSVRHSREARYRQWLTHKLAGWIDQFGTSGCVGCGRCITWCPVGIDLTEEVAAIRATPHALNGGSDGRN